MTTPTTNLTMTNIQTEFGGATPISLSEYYRGATNSYGYNYVPYNQPATAYGTIPSGSTITMGVFRGVTKLLNTTLTISASTQNYTLNTAKVAGYVAGFTRLRVNINAGVVIGSASAGGYAFVIDTSWNSSDTLFIQNGGIIAGNAGNGGRGADANAANFAAGEAGGPALAAQRAVTIDNIGWIGGGGGGGGGTSSNNSVITDLKGVYIRTDYYAGGGGGGGAGNNAGFGGIAGGGGSGGGTAGAPGSIYGTSAGGVVGGFGGAFRGGSGGTLGSAGGASGYGGAGGGAAGACTNGNANITWVNVGSRFGGLG